MNSRQLRKKAAAAHNMARHELAAYQEDRIRDPKKYARKRRVRTSSSMHTSSIGFISCDAAAVRIR